MTKKSFLLPLLSAAVLCSCNDNQNSIDPGAFRFSAMISDYEGSRAMLPARDSAGIFAESPLSVSNRRGVMESSGYLVFNPNLRVVEGSSDSCRICVYLPYTSEMDAAKPAFSVKTDQSDSLSFRKSELNIATASLPVGDNSKATKLEFKPVLALLSLRINNLTDSPVRSVTVREMKGKVFINTSDGSISSANEKTNYSAYADPDSAGIYKLYLAPQEGVISVNAILENGNSYDFSMTATLTVGKYSTNSSSPFVIESKVGPVKPEDFTKLSAPGVYSITDTLFTPVLVYSAGHDQYACSKTSSTLRYRLQNLDRGWIYSLNVSPSQFSEHTGVSVSAMAANCEPLVTGSYDATVLKEDGTLVWIRCNDAPLAFIIREE